MIIRLSSYVKTSLAGWVMFLLCPSSVRFRGACYTLYWPACWSINKKLSSWNVCTSFELVDRLALNMILCYFIYLGCVNPPI